MLKLPLLQLASFCATCGTRKVKVIWKSCQIMWSIYLIQCHMCANVYLRSTVHCDGKTARLGAKKLTYQLGSHRCQLPNRVHTRLCSRNVQHQAVAWYLHNQKHSDLHRTRANKRPPHDASLTDGHRMRQRVAPFGHPHQRDSNQHLSNNNRRRMCSRSVPDVRTYFQWTCS